MTFFEAIIIAIVEGITEFLPISSTGHMILTSALLGVKSSPFLNLYIISIQFGAILSVVVLYWRRFFQSIQLYLYIAAAIIPTVLIALILKKYVDQALGSVLIVGVNLLVGGVLMIVLENYFEKKTLNQSLNYKKSFWIGLCQAISIFPGISRSAATIYGGMSQGLSRKDAAEFSFFLAVPIMFMASVKDGYDYFQSGYPALTTENIQQLILGNIVAFIVAGMAIKFLIQFISKNGFKPFAYYRIVIGLLVIGLILSGISLEMI